MGQGDMVITLGRRQQGQSLPLGQVGQGGAENKAVILQIGDIGDGGNRADKGDLLGDGDGRRHCRQAFAAGRPDKGMNAGFRQQAAGVVGRRTIESVRKVNRHRLPENAAGGINLLYRQQQGTGRRPGLFCRIDGVQHQVRQPQVDNPQAERLRRRRRGSRRLRRRYRRRRSGRSAGGDKPGQQD